MQQGSWIQHLQDEFCKISGSLNSHEWNDILTRDFAQDYDFFFNLLTNEMRERTPQGNDPVKKKSIYMTNDALRLKNAKNRLWRKYSTTKSRYDHSKYVNCNNKLRSLTRKLRKDFEKHITAELKKKPKVFWKYAKSRLKTRESIPPLTRANGTTAKTAKERAETLNTFFVSVFTKENTEDFPSSPKYNIAEALSSINITPEMVLKKLTNFD